MSLDLEGPIAGLLDRLTTALTDALTGALNVVLAPFGGLPAGFALPVGLWHGVAAVALVLLVVVVRRRRPAELGGSREDLAARDAALRGAGVEDWRRPFELLAERGEWRRLPNDFLWELVARLQDSWSTIEFVAFAERHRLTRRVLPRIAKAHAPDAAMTEIAVALLALGRKHKNDAGAALALAVRIEAKNPEVVLNVAADHYRTQEYDLALPLFEQGMTLGQARLETLRSWPNKDPEVERRLATLGTLLKDAAGMYMACLEKASPERG